jgi:hypothetical protein
LTETVAELRVPAPLPEPPSPVLAVGKHAPSSVDAEDFSRKLGNWGNASKFIGDRWEELAPTLLAPRLPWRVPIGPGRTATITAFLALDADPTIGGVLQRAGVSAPDLLLVAPNGPGGRTVLRAADCKVSLDTADREQTTPARLQAMFTRVASDFPTAASALAAQVEALPEASRRVVAEAISAALMADWDRVLAWEGVFIAPDNGFNRWFLDLLETRCRTGAPLGRLPSAGPRRSGAFVKGPVDAIQAARLQLPSHLEPTTAAEFLAEVPGWTEAELVAELDRVSLATVDLCVAERCWRVGVGLRGAVLALKRRLFYPALPLSSTDVDVPTVLKQLTQRRRVRDSGELVRAVAQFVAARYSAWERETALLRMPLSFPAWSARVGEALRAASERGTLARPSTSARAMYRDLTRQHGERLVRAARELERAGVTEPDMLDALEARRQAFYEAASTDAAALIRALIGELAGVSEDIEGEIEGEEAGFADDGAIIGGTPPEAGAAGENL